MRNFEFCDLRYPLLSLLLLLSNPAYSQSQFSEAGSNKNILILFSLSPSAPGYRIILEGIREKMSEEFGDSFSIHTEYLETQNYPRDAYPKEKFDLYNRKYQDIKLDMLICVGVDIVKTIRKNAASYLLDLPAVSIDFDFSLHGYPSDLTINNKTAVFNIRADINKTISEAFKIFPGTTSICFIAGVTRMDQIFMDISKKEAKKINDNISKIFLENMAMDEILLKVKSLPAKCIIILTSFNEDINHVPYYNPESVRLIRISTGLPVFTYSDMGFGDGSFGGKIINFHNIGIKAGETVVSILNGVEPGTIKISEDDYYEYMFDYRELKRFDLAGLENKYKGAIVAYKENNFIQKFKWILFAGTIFIILQSVLIIALIQMQKSQKKMSKQILEAEKKYMEIIHEDRILRTGMLAASITHELNQPLTAILSTAQAGKRFFESGTWKNEQLMDIFNNIVEDDKRAATILSSLRGLMKLETRNKEKVILNKLLLETIDLYRSKAKEQRIKLIVQLTEIPVIVIADAIQIQQVLINLLSNAAQSLEITGSDSREIIISETVNDLNVLISVRDNGIGINAEIRKKLFEPFRTSKSDGMGIGLAISKMIIEEHKGKIWAENISDGGTEFTFSLTIYDDSKS